MSDAETWLTDDDGNRASVEYFGSREAAQAALDSLNICRDCMNCTDCIACVDCVGCEDCEDCVICAGCTGCVACADCVSCVGCQWIKCNCCENHKHGRPLPIPVIESIHAKVYEAASQPGALDMNHWRCEATYCRAGWVVALAGPDGAALEAHFGTVIAASLIYRASSPLPVSQARFDDDDATALADMKRMAELEAAA